MYTTFGNIGKSLKLAWKYKILWLFALLVGTGFSGGGSQNFNSISNLNKNTTTTNTTTNYNFSDYQNNTVVPLNSPSSSGGPINFHDMDNFVPAQGTGNSAMPIPGPKDAGISNVISALSSGQGTSLIQELITPYISNIVIVVLDIFLTYTIIMVVVRSWAIGAFLKGLDEGLVDQGIHLRDLGKVGRARFWELIKYNLVFFVLSLLAFLIIGILIFVSFATKSVLLGLLVALPVSLVLIALGIIFAFVGTFAERFIAIQGKGAMEGLKSGWHLVMRNFGKIVKLGLGNCLVQLGFIMIAGIILAIVIGIGAFVIFVIHGNGASAASYFVNILLVLLIPIFLIVCLAFALLFPAYMATFAAFTWSNLFNYLTNPQMQDASTLNLGYPQSPQVQNSDGGIVTR
jgi:hypothetical protein